jgi:hypothetical protein
MGCVIVEVVDMDLFVATEQTGPILVGSQIHEFLYVIEVPNWRILRPVDGLNQQIGFIAARLATGLRPAGWHRYQKDDYECYQLDDLHERALVRAARVPKYASRR